MISVLNPLEHFGERSLRHIETFGDFCRFCGRTTGWLLADIFRWRSLRLVLPQFYEVGTRSMMVMAITGVFVGAVLAAQTVLQFRARGMEAAVGSIVILSTLRELGPVLAGVMIAGRVGGGLTAELGTMRVTEQIDALRAMGADPLRVLVVPRLLACLLLAPVLVLYVDLTGILGGYIVSVQVYEVNGADFWHTASENIRYMDIFYGPIKSFFFGAAMSLICCYKGFRCRPGAAGVGRACTESFVASCMTILGLNFFLSVLLNELQIRFFGFRGVI